MPPPAEIRPIIRRISAADDTAVAEIIRSVMSEFEAVGPGFAIVDPEVDHMSASYGQEGCAFFVAESSGTIVGGAGIAPLQGGAPGVCELRKMYLLPAARGTGLGRALLERCLTAAEGHGYASCYLETLEHMHAARGLYESFGFRPLARPLGATGHFGCDAWYALELPRG